MFGDDVIHHPVGVRQLQLVSIFCEFADLAWASRLRVLEQAAARSALYVSSHFPPSSAGRVRSVEDGYSWTFETNAEGANLRHAYRAGQPEP